MTKKRKGSVSQETFDDFLANQGTLEACADHAIKEIIAEQLTAGEWKGATVFTASAVEAPLFWQLKGRSDLQQPERLDKLRLSECIAEAQRLSIITKATADQARLATDARTLIHAGKSGQDGTRLHQGERS